MGSQKVYRQQPHGLVDLQNDRVIPLQNLLSRRPDEIFLFKPFLKILESAVLVRKENRDP